MSDSEDSTSPLPKRRRALHVHDGVPPLAPIAAHEAPDDEVTVVEGRQWCVNQKFYTTVDAAHSKLKELKRAARKPWWNYIGIVREGDELTLKCLDPLCTAKFSTANPSARASTHFIEQKDKSLVCKTRVAAGMFAQNIHVSVAYIFSLLFCLMPSMHGCQCSKIGFVKQLRVVAK